MIAGQVTMKKLISIVAPMYNEEASAREYCDEALKLAEQIKGSYDTEVLLVNDGSKDSTFAIMQEQQKLHPDVFSVVALSRNFGLEGAVHAGLAKASGDAVVVMDADLQDPLSLIPEMIRKWENGADIVVASRIKRSNDSFFKKLGARFYYKVLDSLSGKLKLEKSAANFRLLSRKAVNQVMSLPEVNSVFRVVVPFVGMKTDKVEYDRDKRYAGKTKYSLKSMIPYALDSITGISVAPLRKIAFLVPVFLLASFVSLVLALVLSGGWMFFWTAMCVACFVFSIFSVALSVMAEYLAQLMIEVKGRPVSIVYSFEQSLSAKRHQESEEDR